jgi:CHASE1-domain containing sensor protein
VIVSLVVTHQLWKNARYEAVRELQYDFDFRLLDVSNHIEQRMQSLEQALRGVQGLFAASTNVERDEFHAYIVAQHIVESFPGIQDVGFSLVVPAAKQDKHTTIAYKEGIPHIPLAGETRYHCLCYLHRAISGYQRTFSGDMYSISTARCTERVR